MSRESSLGGDGGENGFASAFFSRTLDLVRVLGECEQKAIGQAGAMVAEAWESGGLLLIAKTHHCLHYEAIHRSSGPLGIAVLEDRGDFNESYELVGVRSNDVVLIHVNSGTYGRAVGIALRSGEAGARSIGLTQLPYERDPAVRPGHASGLRLHEVVDVVVDLGGDFGDGALILPGSGKRLAPTSGVLGLLAFWMIVADACDRVVSRGHEPLVLESLLIDGAAERNDRAMAEWRRSGVPFEQDHDFVER